MCEMPRRGCGRRDAAEPPRRPWSVVHYQTTHNTGPAPLFGNDPKTSVLNRYICSPGDVCVSMSLSGKASAFPQNAGYNPDRTQSAADTTGSLDCEPKNLKSPGPGVQ